ncbi:hypothetical protein HX870_09300 [Pseudomonas gingeri]|uniref:Uncharacterized protein n=1 Tax=Pseudomonas gingeri TaxID=117681 RepID=A0A7Y7X8N7_9PSED|nr:hypothetical protein [Pseudomonas gingeri]NWB95065.1 hypothetical protein [Pseudomonas gingeri]NWD67788.1 hypothetical protein [Pseudomonas gingeri]NWD75344.1 hypothetical protein [Pseudomonas gingeri]
MSRLAQCAGEARECAGLFRLGRDVEAALNMVEVFDAAQLALASAPQEVRQQWAQLLTRMLVCQESQDWLGLADWMEYELVGLLESVAIP